MTLFEQADFLSGAKASMELLRATFFHPNILFLRVLPDRDLGDLHELVGQTIEQGMGLVLVVPHPVMELGTEQQINVWVRSQAPEWKLSLRLSNLDLAILLSYQLAWNWKGRITLCMAVTEEKTQREGQEFLTNLIERARLDKFANHHVFVGSFDDAMQTAPQADLTIFGVPGDPKVETIRMLTEKANGSCIFVRDSGNESVLA